MFQSVRSSNGQESPSREPHVAICVNKARSYGRGILQGVADYVEIYGPWSLFVDLHATGELDRDWLHRWQGDGILAFVGDEGVARRLLRSGIPCVEVYGSIETTTLPHVGSDEVAIGRVGAEHLLERQFVRFAFCGVAGASWSESRWRGFSQTVAVTGFDCDRFDVHRDKSTPRAWERTQQSLTRWLGRLPKPIGLMAATDPQAHQVLDACRRARIAVPEEVAVVGVDNDEELCRLTDPPLSSVVNNSKRIGFEAARLLHRLIRREISPADVAPFLIPPQGVVARASTDIAAIEDKEVAEAVSFIRKHACEGIQAKDVARAIRCSRTTLYRRFQQALGRSPKDEVLRVQLDRVKALLSQTPHSLESIAHLAGFSGAAYLSVAFKREIGLTPGEYRAQHVAAK